MDDSRLGRLEPANTRPVDGGGTNTGAGRDQAAAKRRLFALLAARYFCSLGVILQLAGMAWLALGLGGSSVDLGLLTGTMLLPLFLAALAGGVIADRLPPWLVAQGVEMVRAAALASVALLAVGDHLQLWHLYVQAAVVGVARAVGEPTGGGLLARIAPLAGGERANGIGRANAWWQSLTQVGALTANLAFGLFIASSGPAAAFWWGAGAHLVAAVLLQGTRIPERLAAATPAQQRHSVVGDLQQVWQVLRADPALFTAAATAGLPMALLVACNVLTAPFIQALDSDETGYGIMAAAAALAAMLAALACLRIPTITRSLTSQLVVHAALAGIVVAFSAAPNVVVAVALMFALGFAASVANVAHPAYLQHQAPMAVIGRVLSIVQLSMGGLALIFAVGAGLVSAAVSPRIAFAGWGVLFAVSAIALAHQQFRLRLANAAQARAIEVAQ